MGAHLVSPDTDMLLQALQDIATLETGVLSPTDHDTPICIRNAEGEIEDRLYLDAEFNKDKTKIVRLILTPESYYTKYRRYYDEKGKKDGQDR